MENVRFSMEDVKLLVRVYEILKEEYNEKMEFYYKLPKKEQDKYNILPIQIRLENAMRNEWFWNYDKFIDVYHFAQQTSLIKI